MRYVTFFSILCVLLFGLSAMVYSEDIHSGAVSGEQSPALTQNEVEDVGNEICPVSGEPIDKDVSYVYEAKRYYFCCAMCIDEFKKNPEEYIKKVEEELSKSKEKTPVKIKEDGYERYLLQ